MTYRALAFAALIFANLAGCQAQQSASDDVTSLAAQPAAQTFEWPRSYGYMGEDAVLIFSGTLGWRHDSGIAGANNLWVSLGDETGFPFFTTEHPGVFADENLTKFSVIILNSMTGDVLNARQRAALQRFVEAGGGLIAQHGSGDSSQGDDWAWYHDLIGTTFVSHPMDPHTQTARVVTLAPDHPVMSGLGAGFDHADEWYTFDRPVEGEVIVLAGLDESTYSPVNNVYGDVSDLRMGPKPSDHPIIWAKCPGQGRFVYSALGHNAKQYENPAHQTLLTNALAWVKGDGDQGCPE